MNADEIAKSLEELERYGPMIMGEKYSKAVAEASKAFDAVRRMLKIEWESEHVPISFDKEIKKILSEFHLTEEEIKEIKADILIKQKKKYCRDCEFFSEEKCVIGHLCSCPGKKFISTQTAMWKYGSTPACKKFKEKV